MSQNKAKATHYTTALFMAVVVAGVVTGGLLVVAGGLRAAQIAERSEEKQCL